MPLLCPEDVSKSHRSGVHRNAVLRRVSLSVDAGECVAVWGPSASGKTTLPAVAAGIFRPDAGTVRFEGSGTLCDGRLLFNESLPDEGNLAELPARSHALG